MDTNDTKIKVLNSGVDRCKSIINELCSIRPEQHEIKRAEWLDEIGKIKKELESESLLVFIGPFSSGKSTFINTLLGRDILPTADKPCTAVVTELRIVADGQGNRGTIFKKDGSTEPGDYNKLIDVINGPTGAVGKIAQIDHILLEYDAGSNSTGSDISNPLQLLSELGLIIVDCPGYGSPYYTNEEVLEKYISRASFTFWLSPADKLGGSAARLRLSQIRKRTSTLIPVITKSDIVDEQQREKVIEDFQDNLGDLFNYKEPRFISSILYKEAIKLRKEKKKEEKGEGSLPKDKKQEYEKRIGECEMKSGMENLAGDLFNAGSKKIVTDQKVTSSLYDLTDPKNGLLPVLGKQAYNEKTYWETQLKNVGWSEDDAYKKLNKTKGNIDSWIISQSKETSSELETALIADLTAYAMKAKKKMKTDELRRIIADTQKRVFEEKSNEWCKYIEEAYEETYKDLSVESAEKINKINITAPEGISIADSLKDTIFGVFDSIKYAGIGSVITASVGTCAVTAGSSVPFIGTVIFYAGFAFLGLAILPLIPAINTAVKEQHENTRRKAENDLRNWLKKLNVAPIIEQELKKENKRLFENMRDQLTAELQEPLKKREKSIELISEIEEALRDIKTKFDGVM